MTTFYGKDGSKRCVVQDNTIYLVPEDTIYTPLGLRNKLNDGFSPLSLDNIGYCETDMVNPAMMVNRNTGTTLSYSDYGVKSEDGSTVRFNATMSEYQTSTIYDLFTTIWADDDLTFESRIVVLMSKKKAYWKEEK